MVCAVIQNLRSLSDASLRIGGGNRVALVLGKNGAGKSSLAGAIEYALTGANEWTTKGGAGAAALIAHGEKSASVDVAIGDLTIQRTIKGNGTSVSVGEYSGEKATAMLALALPDPDLLRCMLRSDAFVTLKGKEQQDILFKLAGGQVDADWVSEKLTNAEREAIPEALSTRLQGSDLMKHLHDTVYGQRTEANTRVKELEAKAAGAPPGEIADLEGEAEKLRVALARAKNVLAERQQQAGAAEAQIAAHEAAKRRWEMAQETFKAAQAALQEHGPRPDAVSDEQLEELRTAMQAAETALSDANSAHVQASTPLIAARAREEQIAKLGKTCVLAHDIPCPMTEEQIATLRESASVAVVEAERAEQAAAETLRAARTAYKIAANAFSEAQAQHTAAEQWDAKAEFLREKLAAAQAALDTANAEYQANPAPNAETVQSNLASAQRAVEDLDARYKAALDAVTACQQYGRITQDLERARERAALLDTLVGKFSPKGLPAEAMQSTIGAVIDQINDVLAEFCDLEVSFTDELLVAYLPAQEAPIPVRYLSESEQLRVGSAISVAFAKLTGFNFVVVDAADRLDGRSRLPHLKMLVHSGVHALVLATPANGNRPQMDGLVVYELANGRLTLDTTHTTTQGAISQ